MVVKMWSILEYDQEVEEKKLRKAEYEAGLETGRSEGITIGKNQGIEIGRSEGITIGKNQGIELILQSIQKSGYSLEQIAEMTGRPVEEVKRILKVMP